jgi:hypothetical protein
MAYQVPESKRSIAQNRFEFSLPDGTQVSIPKAKYLTVGQIEILSEKQGNQEVKLTDLLDLFNEPAAAKAVRTLDSEQLQALMAAWQEDSKLTLGESSVSGLSS